MEHPDILRMPLLCRVKKQLTEIMKRIKLSMMGIASLLCVLFPQEAVARDAGNQLDKADLEGWYVGVETGFPFAVSTFTSFGTDRARFGWNVIPYVGYRFNPVLSLEGQALWGREHLSSRESQADILLNGWRFGDLQSDVFTQRYTAQLNFNLLGFYERTRYSRWTLEVAPSISAIGTKATIRPIEGGDHVLEAGARWHFGVGANLESAYRITRNFFAGIYTNIHFLTGRQLDGVPAGGYSSNYIWDVGLTLGWAFGKQ